MSTDADTQVVEPEASEAETARRRELEHYEEITKLNQTVVAARSEWAGAKKDAGAAKKEYDGLVQQLQTLILRGPDMQHKLPFSGDETDGQKAASDAWRDVPVAEALALSAGQLDKLEEAGVKTVGQLEDLRAGDEINSINGFGQATVDKIEDQIIDWLDDNRDKFGEVIDEQPDDDENNDDREPLDDM